MAGGGGLSRLFAAAGAVHLAALALADGDRVALQVLVIVDDRADRVLHRPHPLDVGRGRAANQHGHGIAVPAGRGDDADVVIAGLLAIEDLAGAGRSEEHTSELQSLMRISYAVFCLKKKTYKQNNSKNEIT